MPIEKSEKMMISQPKKTEIEEEVSEEREADDVTSEERANDETVPEDEEAEDVMPQERTEERRPSKNQRAFSHEEMKHVEKIEERSPPPSYENSILQGEGGNNTATNSDDSLDEANQQVVTPINLAIARHQAEPLNFQEEISEERRETEEIDIATIPSNKILKMTQRQAKVESSLSLGEVLERYEIGEEFSSKLSFLKDFKIIFLLDDSSSMKHLLNDSPLLKLQPRVARWNELQYFANIGLQIANFYDTEGCDVYFLNNTKCIKKCRSLVDLNNLFKTTKPKVNIYLKYLLLCNSNFIFKSFIIWYKKLENFYYSKNLYFLMLNTYF